MGVSGGVSDTPMTPPDAPMMRASQGTSDTLHYAPMLFFDNLVKSFHQIVKK